MPAGEDEIYRSLRFDSDEVNFSKWPKLSCSAANELTLATPPTQDDPNPGVARLAIAGELKLQAGIAVNELSSDEKLTNNSDLAIPTQKAVKTYVDAQIGQVNQSLSVKAALAGASSQDFQTKNLTVSGDLSTTGKVGIGTTAPSSKLDVRGNLFVQAEVRADGGFQVDGQTVIDADAGWHRSYGNTGWYNGTHGGGWYMADSNWIRSYGGKNVYHDTGVLRTDGIFQVGPDGNRFVVNTSGNIGMSSDRVFGCNPSDKFIYDGKEMGHYSLGWFSDRWDSNGATAWLSGYSGVKLFSRGQLRFWVEGGGNVRYAVSSERSSSRELKESIAVLPAQEAIETLEGLNPVKYNLKADKEKNLHIGFIAEDVPDLVASRDRKAISTDHIVAVLTKVVKEQHKTISVLTEKIKGLEKQN